MQDYDDTDILSLEVLGQTLRKPGETGPVRLSKPPMEDQDVESDIDMTLQDIAEERQPEDDLGLAVLGKTVRPASSASGSTGAPPSEEALSFAGSEEFLRPNLSSPDLSRLDHFAQRPSSAFSLASSAAQDAWGDLKIRPRGHVVNVGAWRPSKAVSSESQIAAPTNIWCKLSSQQRIDSIRENPETAGNSYLTRAVDLASATNARPPTSPMARTNAISEALSATSSKKASKTSIGGAKYLPSKMHSQRWWSRSMLDVRDETMQAVLEPERDIFYFPPAPESRPPSRVGSSGSLRSSGSVAVKKGKWPAGLPTVAFAPAPYGGFPEDSNSRVGHP
eukprot:CAMPEP_0197625716 /NCGR_PEP_ID=MMETSP1338-20131121/5001_1 /TAXON_ID=43686 ORGANISM="Pelagodinium beii, Strain RCC1491" /NCGR_SAMPLE_ID=MMETSP1338 /ASSEMBLY_ACC=CAM_ASM_000754 /LENGTH=334 /DNA_ID=CAMNT_0043196185 /DNA_START=114 /DNA_END=1118 /DNA_ORIENTATION=-